MTPENVDLQTNNPAIPDTLPVLLLRGTVIFPMAVVPLAVGRPESVKLVDDVMRGGRLVALVAQRTDTAVAATLDNLYPVGTAGIVHQLARLPDGSLRLMVQGIERIRLVDFLQTEPYLVARIALAPDTRETTAESTETAALRRAAVDLFRQLVGLAGDLPDEVAMAAENLIDGPPEETFALLESLATGPGASAGLDKTRSSWLAKVAAYRDRLAKEVRKRQKQRAAALKARPSATAHPEK